MPSGVIGGTLGAVGGTFGAVGAPPAGFTDDFTRANGPIGAPWTSHAGTWSINGNRAAVTASNGTEASTSVDVGSADMAVEWELTTLASSNGILYFPVRIVDANNYLFFTNSSGFSSRIYCYHRTGGTNYQIGTFGSANWLNINTTIRVEAEGTTLRLYSGGSLVDTRTGVTQHQTATRAGLAGYRNASATIQSARWSRFHCAPL